VACSGDTQGSCFRASDTAEPRLHHWKNNHIIVNTLQEWGSLKGPFPNLAPITAAVKIKHSTHNVFTGKMTSSTAGDWTDKTEFFLPEFEDVVPAAIVQGEMAISDLQDPNSNVFVFSGIEILGADLATLQQGHVNALERPQAARNQTRLLHFTFTAHPRSTNPGAIDVNPAQFLSQMAMTVILRALTKANATLHPEITKNLPETAPKILLQS
jgi:hypothetical protein